MMRTQQSVDKLPLVVSYDKLYACYKIRSPSIYSLAYDSPSLSILGLPQTGLRIGQVFPSLHC